MRLARTKTVATAPTEESADQSSLRLVAFAPPARGEIIEIIARIRTRDIYETNKVLQRVNVCSREVINHEVDIDNASTNVSLEQGAHSSVEVRTQGQYMNINADVEPVVPVKDPAPSLKREPFAVC